MCVLSSSYDLTPDGCYVGCCVFFLGWPGFTCEYGLVNPTWGMSRRHDADGNSGRGRRGYPQYNVNELRVSEWREWVSKSESLRQHSQLSHSLGYVTGYYGISYSLWWCQCQTIAQQAHILSFAESSGNHIGINECIYLWVYDLRHLRQKRVYFYLPAC